MKELGISLSILFAVILLVAGAINFVSIVGWWGLGLFVAAFLCELLVAVFIVFRDDDYAEKVRGIEKWNSEFYVRHPMADYMELMTDQRGNAELTALKRKAERSQLKVTFTALLTIGLIGDFVWLVWPHSWLAAVSGVLFLAIVAVLLLVSLEHHNNEELSETETHNASSYTDSLRF